MTIHPSRLLEYLNTGRAISMGTDRSEVRMLSGVVNSMFFYQLMEAGIWIAAVEQSMTYKIAGLLHSRSVIAGLFFFAAAMLVPMLFVIMVKPALLWCKFPRKMAAFAAIFGAVLWALLAVMSLPVDADWVTTVFAIKAVIDLGFGLIYGISLNAQHARETQEVLERKKAMGAFSNDEQVHGG